MSWEIDFWGRFRRSIEAADAAIDASIANFDDVLTLLLADVTSNYIQYRTLQERLRLTRENVRIQEASYELTLGNFRAGAVTERDVQQARQILEQTRSAIPQLEAGLRRTNNALCVLMGMAPTDLSSRLGETGSIPMGRPEWDAGIPADLLRRRPDVRRAEREVAIQSATIGITKADLYPRFFLAGSVGVQAENFGDIFSLPSSLTLFGGPGFQWNILNYGRIESAVAAQEARFRQFFSRYQAVVLQANREAEDAIIGFFKAQERVRHLSESVAAARRTYEITFDQYREGAIDFTPVFIFQAALTNQEDQLAQAQADISLSLVELYRSLGGGWESRQVEDGFAAARVAAPSRPAGEPQRPMPPVPPAAPPGADPLPSGLPSQDP